MRSSLLDDTSGKSSNHRCINKDLSYDLKLFKKVKKGLVIVSDLDKRAKCIKVILCL